MEEISFIGYEIIEDLENKMGSLALSYFASIQRLNTIIELPVNNAEETGIYDRWKTKEIYGAAMQYSEFLHEMSFLALAKITEDTKIDLKRKLNIKFHPFDDNLNLPYMKHLRTCWALANIIKHNQSNFAKGTSESADYILKEWDIKDWYDLEVYIDARHPLCEIYEYIPKVYLSLCSFIQQSTGAESHFMKDDWLEMVEVFYRYLLPETAGIRIPTQEDHHPLF